MDVYSKFSEQMTDKKVQSMTTPDSLFEVSWEVCNKVGGIHTVISTKAQTVTNLFGDRYILIGPDIGRDGANPEFEEDTKLMRGWREELYDKGLRVRIGRWKVSGNPIVVLVDFTSLFSSKNEVLAFLWESYRVDSISGQWDYIEPVLFGVAAGKVIESYVETFCAPTDDIVAHFHEWMTGSGGLYLQEHSPRIATTFTTHATILGRTLAGNNEPLYSKLQEFDGYSYAKKYRIVAKYSIERISANTLDSFTTVSDITARECKYLLEREVSLVTPNGFEDEFVWKGEELERRRREAKDAMIKVAEACLGHKFEKEPLIVGTSGRYEFKNKGLDVLIESLKRLADNQELQREVLVYITVPAGNEGARKDLIAHLNDPNSPIDNSQYRHTTHILSGWDPIVNAMEGSRLLDPESKVKVIFVPSYLNGNDGIFNKQYYELLVGMDATVFPSYYEPWGYTPLESVAFSVPTITTSLAGFGLWVKEYASVDSGVEVVERTEDNDAETIDAIAESIYDYCNMDNATYQNCRKSAAELSRRALWENFYVHYLRAYDIALERAKTRDKERLYQEGGKAEEQVTFVRQQLESNRPTWTRLMVQKSLPERLKPLEVISKNMWWTWTTWAHELFAYADFELWAKTERNPIELLERLSGERIDELNNDKKFLDKLDKTYKLFQEYMEEKKHAKGPKIAYLCMEYGLHSSLKIYSGGLGVLAGDYLKEASDKNVPMVAIGLLYRYGYFMQRLSAQGAQEASYEPEDFYQLPITPARDESGNWLTVRLGFPGRTVTARIWRCDVGRTELYLLDTDHDLNIAEDRSITHHLYGGDWENRLKQELLLGVGGIRALDVLGYEQEIFHCNEGHAALMGIERIHNLVRDDKLTFSEALEVVRSSSLFTTHTPVPAGHDAFPESMIRQYMPHYPDRLGITWDQFINLGKTNPNNPNERFSMSFLACNLCQEVNGVSWLHGKISKEILGGMWPGYFKDELENIGYVTNGVHFWTWASANFKELYEKYFPEGFMEKQYDIEAWQKIHEVDDEVIWAERMKLKEYLIDKIRARMVDPQQMLYASPSQMVKIAESMQPDVLTIGFARRFATYKRADLLFTNLDRLDKIVNHPERPVQFVFAGKAHPNDQPGQDLIKRIVEVAAMPQFEGKIVFLQNYDMALSRNMTQGVDVWLNTPTRPQEASGTSGMKACMNGAMQFGVLDGWWVEGYKEGAGWMLPKKAIFADNTYQNELDAEMIYATIEQQIAPMYYRRDENNVPYEWIATVKNCIAEIGPNFTTNRMLTDYQERYYNKLYARNSKLSEDNFAEAREVAAWKRRVSASWDDVHVVSSKQIDMGKEEFVAEKVYSVEVAVDIASLSPEDIGVELVVAEQIDDEPISVRMSAPLNYIRSEGSVAHYSLELQPEDPGSFDVALRVYPKNDKLPHRMDFALVKWV